MCIRDRSDNGTPNAYPGTPLREGSSGQNVRLVQFWLKIARTVYTLSLIHIYISSCGISMVKESALPG